MTSLCAPMAAPSVVSVCGTCPTCCSVATNKRAIEKIQIAMPWHHRLPQFGQWKLRSAKHTVKQQTGSSLTQPAYDLTASYIVGATVAVGSAVYVCAVASGPAQSPWLVPANWTLQPAAKTDLYVTLDTDFVAEEWISDVQVASYALVTAGVDDTSYRVEVEATFRDCDGRLMSLWDCIQVNVIDCD